MFSHLGCDGWIRVWDLESIFNAKAVDTEDVDKTLFRLDPMNEVQVEVGAILKSIVRSKRKMEDHNDWFLQVTLHMLKRSQHLLVSFLIWDRYLNISILRLNL